MKCFIKQSQSYNGKTNVWRKCFTVISGTVGNTNVFYTIKAWSTIHLKGSKKS